MKINSLLASLTLCLIFFQSNQAYAFEEISEFGENPGNLKCFVHYPKNFDKNLKYPLVVALHGCSQTAENIALQSGWNDLADKNDFIVLYPEQKLINNTSKCFNWFLTEDTQGSEGELGSIMAMVQYIKKQEVIIDSNVYCYGLSAGAAMSVVLLANEPNTFKSGAIFAGGPYGMAGHLTDAWKSMQNPTPHEGDFWLNKLPFPNAEKKPNLIVCHGTDDMVVDPGASQELLKQWCAWHQCSFTPNSRSFVDKHPMVQLETYGENDEIKFYQFSGLGHALPVDPGTGPHQGGQKGLFSRDEDFFSTYYIAKDFGLIK